MDLVSIIIPVYNIEGVITHSLDAVLDQTYKAIELILVDDGSSDNSIKVAEEYLVGTGMVYNIISQPNKGLSSARNTGIKAAKGTWFLCLDGDDYILPNTIETMVRTARDENVKCVFCGFKTVNDSSLKSEVYLDNGIDMFSSETIRRLFFYRKLIPIVPGMLLHRSIYDEILYDEECRYCEDILFLWKLFYKESRYAFIKADLYNYYRRDDSIMHSLTPETYLSSSPRHRDSAIMIENAYPKDGIAKMIYPKFRLAGLRIICRYNSYDDFKKTVVDDGNNAYIKALLKQPNLKLFVYALLFIVSKRLFYLISK